MQVKFWSRAQSAFWFAWQKIITDTVVNYLSLVCVLSRYKPELKDFAQNPTPCTGNGLPVHPKMRKYRIEKAVKMTQKQMIEWHNPQICQIQTSFTELQLKPERLKLEKVQVDNYLRLIHHEESSCQSKNENHPSATQQCVPKQVYVQQPQKT